MQKNGVSNFHRVTPLVCVYKVVFILAETSSLHGHKREYSCFGLMPGSYWYEIFTRIYRDRPSPWLLYGRLKYSIVSCWCIICFLMYLE